MMRLDKLVSIRAAVNANASDAELLRLIGAPKGTQISGIIYKGPSMIDGEPIMAIATCNSSNPKTGSALVQIWIIRADMHPQEALTTGADKAICGNCAFRPNPTSKILKSGPNKGNTQTKLNRPCYVNIMGPTSVWNTFNRGGYREIQPADFAGSYIRHGAYGEPPALPVALFNEINKYAAGWVGYTHLWHTKQGSKFKGSLMASVDTPAQEIRAQAAGWSTFRVGLKDGSDKSTTTECPATATKGEIQCSDCMACDGSGSQSIYVPAHGQTAKFVPAERLARRKPAPVRKRPGFRAA